MQLDDFVQKYMKKGRRHVPGRLQAALALLEKLREKPSLDLSAHLASKGSSGLESHEAFGQRVHDRLKLDAINKTHGRRSSNLQDWGQDLLERLRTEGFVEAPPPVRAGMIDHAQAELVKPLEAILYQEPLFTRLAGRSGEAVIHELLKQAEVKGKGGDVAQYLVGATLMLCLGEEAIPVLPANKGDRKSRGDQEARLGDFEVGHTVIEVAMGPPDDKHLTQMALALDEPKMGVWLLTRGDRVAAWKNEVQESEEIDTRRAVVASVEGFVGQYVTDRGGFSNEGKTSQLIALFEVYNRKWVDKLGPAGIKILAK